MIFKGNIMARESPLIYIMENKKLIDIQIICESATSPLPTPTELEIYRIVKEHRRLRNALEGIRDYLMEYHRNSVYRECKLQINQGLTKMGDIC